MRKLTYIIPLMMLLFSVSCGSTQQTIDKTESSEKKLTENQTKVMQVEDINQMPQSDPAPVIKF